MIINYLHIVSVLFLPIKTNSPLVVNSDAVLSRTIADEFFQTIRRRDAKVVDCFGIVQHSQFSQSNLLNVGRQFARACKIVDFPGFGIFERFNCAKRLWRKIYSIL